jgi:uridine kinase/putative flippase GtrA
MSVMEKLKAKDDRLQSQVPRFALIGALSTLINYAVFFGLFGLLGIDYIASSGIGYIAGLVFGYIFNARLTFRSTPGLSMIPYFIVYTASLVASLGVLSFQVGVLGIDPLLANVISICFSTATNFLGTRYIAFNRNFRIPTFFRSRLFIAALAVKLVFAAFFASDFLTQLFVPFVQYFVENPFSNPYEHFFELGNTNIFPYPPFMLFSLGIPHILLYALKSGSAIFSIFAIRLSLIAADLVIFYILCRLLPQKEKFATLLYWCSPVIFYINYIHGQLDIIPVALLFSSTYFLVKKKLLSSALFFGLGIASKSYLFVALPIYLIYLLKKKYSAITMARYFAFVGVVYAALLSPYVLSEGFIKLVFLAPEQYRLLDLSVGFASNLAFYIVPAAYAYILFKAYSFKKITKEMLFVLLGLSSTLLVTLINPARGWYLWPIPFVVYFFIKERRLNPWIYASFNAFYLLYFLFISESDVFNVFQIVSPSIATLAVPYNYLLSLGLHAQMVVSILFTALTSTLLYTSYLIYRNGVRNNFMFQEQNGIPVIGVSGDSGAGKTTFVESLCNFFGRQNVTVIHGDDIHKWERYDPNWKKYTHLNPIANTINANYKQLRFLKAGQPIRRRRYDHKTGKFTEPIEIQPKNLIVSEGLHTLFVNESNSVYNLKIYMDPDPNLRLLWKIRRDLRDRKYTLKKVIEQIKRRKQDSEKFISPQKYYSDLVISYKPTGKILFSRVDNPVSTYLEISVKSDIPLDNFVEMLLKCEHLKVEIEYPDYRFLKVALQGSVDKHEIQSMLRSLNLDHEEYGIDINRFGESLEGVAQVLVLYCLNERLKAMQRGDEVELRNEVAF